MIDQSFASVPTSFVRRGMNYNGRFVNHWLVHLKSSTEDHLSLNNDYRTAM